MNIQARTTTDFGNWNDIWEGIKNDKHIEETTEGKNQIHEPIEDVQRDAASFLLGRCW